jgi:uncharacterized protein
MSPVGLAAARLMCVLAFVMAAAAAGALDVPPLTGRVVDRAQVMPAELAAQLTRELEAHEARTGNQVAVLILPSLDGEPLESYSHRVATTWELGRKGTDNGVLVLIALRERKIRIEVGYGLEGTLTDLRASRIIRQDMVPRFRAGDVPAGVAAGVRRVLESIDGHGSDGTTPERPAALPSGGNYLLVGILVGTLAGLILSQGLHRTRAFLGSALAYLIAQFGGVLLGILAAASTALLLVLLLQAGRGDRGRSVRWGRETGWAGGAWGGGFGGMGGGGFGGGGGDFGGGGASGDW